MPLRKPIRSGRVKSFPPLSWTRAHYFAKPVVGNAYHRRRLDIRMHVKKVFHLAGCDPLPAALDDILLAPGYVNVTEFVDLPRSPIL